MMVAVPRPASPLMFNSFGATLAEKIKETTMTYGAKNRFKTGREGFAVQCCSEILNFSL